MVRYIETNELVAGKMGIAYIQIDDERYELANLKELTAQIDYDIATEKRLGKVLNMHKVVGGDGTGTATFFFNTSTFRKFGERFKDSGKYFYFNIVIVNNDPSTNIGEQQIILKDCCFKTNVLAKLDVSGTEALTETADFFFDDYHIETEFTTDYKEKA